MPEIKDGGAAFPLAYAETNEHGVQFPFVHAGMTKRDWYAGQALVGLMGDPGLRPSSTAEFVHMARRLFQVADAMLAERNKIASPAGETIRLAQDEAMEASPVTAQPAVGEVSPQIAERIRKNLVTVLGGVADNCADTASIVDDLGADSLDLVELVMAFEEEFGIEVPDADAEGLFTVGDVVRYIERKVRRG